MLVVLETLILFRCARFTIFPRMDEIMASFLKMEGRRSRINRRYPLPSVPTIAVLAVLAGATRVAVVA